ncbi:MAG: hypothetical protein O7H41_09620 [Planctomycetota bacterium]|nr:hypothetical protein [Planctomycetota bacterium]
MLLLGCPRGGGSISDEDALQALLASEEARAYAGRADEAGRADLDPLARAALGLSRLRDGERVQAISDLRGVSPRAMERFERKLLFLVRGAAYYSEGWYDLAAREFKEAVEITLKVEEVNVEGENTEPILITDLLATAGQVLSTTDRELGQANLDRVQAAALLVGDPIVLWFARAEIARRGGARDELSVAIEGLRPVVSGEREGSLDRALKDLKAGRDPDLGWLTESRFLMDLGGHLLEPILDATRARQPVEVAFREAKEFRGALAKKDRKEGPP